ncbi:lipoate--protein ligase family protein [Candidatus Viridilinea mediisalina]|uniref:Ligase n=1 Tax=Candidatus Viridilinea mediisalina TaxID=2024553 RepID=A0A2A6RP74_9CHLR|nr:ligase [Candidatus Viridilinea mediisalina]PDW04735.1 ligase [Candidatus Viridilinea mediisalina]
MTDQPNAWRMLPSSDDPADLALARAEGLLAGLVAHGRPALRWYGAQQRAMVLGSGQRLSELDAAALQVAGVSLHRRASGGTAVLFVPGLLMQDIALPLDHPLYQHDVTASYAWLGAVWMASLAQLGCTELSLVSVAAARADAQQSDPLVRRACFGGRSPYEVLVGGRKLVGFSQVRRRMGALFQVGLYTHWPGAELVALLRLSPAERVATSAALAARVAGLAEVHPKPPSHNAIMDTFAATLAQHHHIVLEATPWSPKEQVATQGALGRYAPVSHQAFVSHHA